MSYEIRAMGFGEILDMGFQLLRNHFLLLSSIGVVFYLPFTYAVELLAAGGAPTPEGILVLLGVALVAVALVNPIVAVGVTHALGECYLGRSATVGGALRVGLSILLPLIGTSILAVLAQLVGFAIPVGVAVAVGAGASAVLGSPLLAAPIVLVAGAAALVPGIYLVLSFLVYQQIVVLERVFGFQTLSRSHELMRGSKLRGLGVVVVAWLIITVASAGVGIVGSVVPWLGPLLQAGAQAVGYAFMSAVLVVFYFDVRCRREAFDLEHLARLVEDEAPGAPAPVA